MRTNPTVTLACRVAALLVLGSLASCTASFRDPGRAVPHAAPASAAVFNREIVAADHPQASEAGARMLALGGNAVDAAVATGFALSVVRPESCGIGGGGFMVIHLARDPKTPGGAPPEPIDLVIDYRERAPASSRPDMFESLPAGASEHSGKAVAVPGTVAGLLFALERYGTLPREAVLAPAIEIAEKGAIPDAHSRHVAKRFDEFLHTRASLEQQDIEWLRAQFVTPAITDPARPTPNPGHAEALRRIAREGARGFYEGPTAAAIVDAVNRTGGGLTLEDLRAVRPVERAPLKSAWRNRTIVTMPLPSSGGMTLIQTLALMDDRADLWDGDAPRGPRVRHALAESFKHAFADRARYLGDPAFMPADPTPRLLDAERLRRKAAMLRADRTLDADAYAKAEELADLAGAPRPLPDDHGTSHLSVVDRWGNAVACTETINLSFGSKIPVRGLGFCLNNQMDDFQTRRGAANAFGLVQSDRNLPEPGKVPLSSMTPVIVLDATGKVEMVAGGSGGPRIITAVTQAVFGALVMSEGAACVSAARIHHQWAPDRLEYEALANASEPGRVVPEADAGRTATALRERGHTVVPAAEPAAVQVILRTPEGWLGMCDPRKGGRPAGH